MERGIACSEERAEGFPPSTVATLWTYHGIVSLFGFNLFNAMLPGVGGHSRAVQTLLDAGTLHPAGGVCLSGPRKWTVKTASWRGGRRHTRCGSRLRAPGQWAAAPTDRTFKQEFREKIVYTLRDSGLRAFSPGPHTPAWHPGGRPGLRRDGRAGDRPPGALQRGPSFPREHDPFLARASVPLTLSLLSEKFFHPCLPSPICFAVFGLSRKHYFSALSAPGMGAVQPGGPSACTQVLA